MYPLCHKKTFVVLILSVTLPLHAQRLLTLEDCRDLAATDNKQAQIDHEAELSAKYMRQAAIANFFPQISANGAYLYNQKHLHILGEDSEFSWGTIGNSGIRFNDPTIQTIGALFPTLSQGVNRFTGNAYNDFYNLFDLDVTHVLVGQVGAVQPIWMGGKIIQGYKIAKHIENIEKIKSQKDAGETTVKVDEAYWRVISVRQKQQLAQDYHHLLQQLLSDVQAAVDEGVATPADVLKVRVKLNEAEASLAQANDGLVLSKMALCQLIGLPLDADIVLDETGLFQVILAGDSVASVEDIVHQRSEIQMLDEANAIAKSAVWFTASSLQPTVVATANYIITNPNVHNGFQNEFSGQFSAGVIVHVPIAHPADILAVKAAKHRAKTVQLKMEDAQEMIKLQVTQSAQKVAEANAALIRANSSIQSAEENLRYAQESYQEGVITASDLMMAQTAWQKAYSEKIDAACNLRVAEITYKQHSGQL